MWIYDAIQHTNYPFDHFLSDYSLRLFEPHPSTQRWSIIWDAGGLYFMVSGVNYISDPVTYLIIKLKVHKVTCATKTWKSRGMNI